MRINGSLIINAPNVTIRRVEVIGGSINNFQGPTCQNGLVIENTTVRRGSGQTSGDFPAINAGGYTARGVLIDGLPEGFRVGGVGDCGPVVIENSYARVVAPDVCGDWHGDGLQGYFGPALTIRNTVLEFIERSGCGGTAPFFVPDGQGNTSVDIDGLIVIGGGYSFRLGVPSHRQTSEDRRGLVVLRADQCQVLRRDRMGCVHRPTRRLRTTGRHPRSAVQHELGELNPALGRSSSRHADLVVRPARQE